MNEKLTEALNEISDKHINEAASVKRRRPYWIGAVAAALAVVILVSVFYNPITAEAVSLADYSQGDRSFYSEVSDYMDHLTPFWAQSMALILGGSEENQTYSPVNLYMALSALAEMTESEQILQALGTDSLDALRTHTYEIWNVSYLDNGNQCLLANSLWLDQDLSYDQTVMDALAQHHYTSVYQGDFGTQRTDNAIAAWLNQQTGNLLKDTTSKIRHDADTVFALYATICYQAKWRNAFSAANNEDGIFHAPGGDITCTYMKEKLMQTSYYWGEDFGAVSLGLKDGSQMWLILPDEDKTVDDVLAGGEYLQMLLDSQYENTKYMKVNLSLPKFDIRSSGDLSQALQDMGITDVFDPATSGFYGTFPGFGGPIRVDSVNQATRVAIDEKGVTAASYLEFPGASSAAPPEEIIDFVLDRPFLFVVTNFADIPLFAGVVNEP